MTEHKWVAYYEPCDYKMQTFQTREEAKEWLIDQISLEGIPVSYTGIDGWIAEIKTKTVMVSATEKGESFFDVVLREIE